MMQRNHGRDFSILQLAHIQIHVPIVIETIIIIIGVHNGMMLGPIEKDGISSLIPIKMVPTGQILWLMVFLFENSQRMMIQHFSNLTSQIQRQISQIST
jgi:hypothetical protein